MGFSFLAIASNKAESYTAFNRRKALSDKSLKTSRDCVSINLMAFSLTSCSKFISAGSVSIPFRSFNIGFNNQSAAATLLPETGVGFLNFLSSITGKAFFFILVFPFCLFFAVSSIGKKAVAVKFSPSMATATKKQRRRS